MENEGISDWLKNELRTERMRHLLETKKRIHPLEGTNAFASAVPPWLGCCFNKNSPVKALGEKISQPHSFKYGRNSAIPFTLITVAIPARAT